jgi:hypothetical protein
MSVGRARRVSVAVDPVSSAFLDADTMPIKIINYDVDEDVAYVGADKNR